MTANDLLAAVRRAQGMPSNYALAKFLDLRENTLWRWSSGRNTPDDPTTVRLAELAGIDPDVALASMQAQRASNETDRARWERIAERLERSAATTAAAAVACLGMLLPVPPAHAFPGAAGEGLKIMSTRKRRIMAAVALLILQSRQQ